MPYLLAVDPGKRACGVALFDTSIAELLACKLVRNPCKDEDDLALCAGMARAVVEWCSREAVCPSVFVCERPRIYTVGKQRKGGNWTDPNDLPPLFGVDVGIAVLLPAVKLRSVEPKVWKGTTTKEVMNARVMHRLHVRELSLARDADHNVLDAIGIGLWHLGRLERTRVYPGAT